MNNCSNLKTLRGEGSEGHCDICGTGVCVVEMANTNSALLGTIDDSDVVYISGPMTGIPQFNMHAFNRVAKHLRDFCGVTRLFNPAEESANLLGADYLIKNATGTGEADQTRRDLLAVDAAWVCKHATVIVMLPGWQASSGARMEIACAQATNSCRVIYLKP